MQIITSVAVLRKSSPKRTENVGSENGDNNDEVRSYWQLSPSYYHSKEPMPCELCGDMFTVPVSFHMLTAHPGCGQSCGGRGYNSKGTYKNGWSGPCGEGGIAWFQFCESCRSGCMKRAKPIQPSAASGSGPAPRSRKTAAVVRQAVANYPATNNDDDGRDFSDSDDEGNDEDRRGWNSKPLQLKHLHGLYTYSDHLLYQVLLKS